MATKERLGSWWHWVGLSQAAPAFAISGERDHLANELAGVRPSGLKIGRVSPCAALIRDIIATALLCASMASWPRETEYSIGNARMDAMPWSNPMCVCYVNHTKPNALSEQDKAEQTGTRVCFRW